MANVRLSACCGPETMPGSSSYLHVKLQPGQELPLITVHPSLKTLPGMNPRFYAPGQIKGIQHPGDIHLVSPTSVHVTRCFGTASIQQDRRVRSAWRYLFLCSPMSAIPLVKHCNVYDVVSVVRDPSPKPTRHPTQEKLHEMRCPATATFSPQAPVPCKREPQPSSHHPAQKPQQRRATSIHSCHTKESAPLYSLVAFWNIHLQAPSRPPTTALGRVFHRWVLQTGQTLACHWRATDGRVFTPVRNRSTHVSILPDIVSTTIAKIWHNTYAG
jgi:hypothetical protein